jgi:DNA-binding HxlR family transcriptional regulator
VSFKTQPTPPVSAPRQCSIADALEILGDRWSLLIVRECGYGNRRFNEIQRHTGAPRNILASRLKRMEDVGILHPEIYSEHPRRHEYSLTDSGKELFPILLAFREWGEERLHAGEPAVNPVWHKCGAELRVETVCSHCHEVVQAEDLQYG